jgi:hypothetical protein
MATLDELLVKVGADLDDLESGMDAGVKTVEKAMGRIVGDADKAGAQVDQAGAKAAKAFDGLDASADKAGMALKGVGADADKAGAQVEGAGKGAGDGFVRGVMSGLAGLDSKVGAVAEGAFDKLKGPALAGGAAAGATFMMGLNEVFSREAGTDAVAARLGLGPDASARVGRVSGKLFAGAYGESMEEVGSAVDAVMSTLPGMLGASDSAIENTTAKALDLANGFGFDVVQSVGLAGISISHGLARDSDHAFDLIVASMQKMPANMREELFPAIEEYGGFLTAMGFTGEEAFGLLAAASHDGMFAIDKTGDAVKELSIRATDMSTTSVEAFEAAGLNADKMAARFLAGGDSARGALTDLVNGLLGIEDPTERANAAIKLFGTPLEDLNVTEIPTFLQSLIDMDASLGDVGGAAEMFGVQLNENAATNIEAFKRKTLGGLINFIGEEAIPAGKRLADTYGDDLGRGFAAAKGFFKDNEKALTGLKVTAGVVAASVATHYTIIGVKATWAAVRSVAASVRMVAGWVATGVSAAVNAAIVVGSWLLIGARALAAGVVSAVQFAIHVAGWIAMGVAAVVNAALIAASWLIAMGPMALVALAVIGLAALFVVHFDTIKNAVLAAFNWVKENWPLLLAILTGPIGLAVLAIVRNWDTIKAGVTAVKDWIVARFNDVIGFIKGLPGAIGRAASGMWNGISDAFKSVINTIIGWWNNLKFPKFDIPKVHVPGTNIDIGGGSIGGWNLPNIPTLAEGGIATGPTLAMIGEGRFDEAVVPLPRGLRDLGGGGAGTTVIMNNAGSIMAERDIVRLVQDAIDRGQIRGAA